MAIQLGELAKPFAPEPLLGFLDYYRFPERRDQRGPFNGQPGRVALFRYIFETFKPTALVETGTFLGATTNFLASFGRPVFTVECQARTYGLARARLINRRNVTMSRGDSRVVLRRWLAGPLRRLAEAETLFFYLDAHGSNDLPVAEELGIVFGRCPRAVVMLNDFQVPGDPGYTFADNGPGQALTPNYIALAVEFHRLAVFYPTIPSKYETRSPRGCAVLASAAIHGDALASLALLRSAQLPSLRPALRSSPLA